MAARKAEADAREALRQREAMFAAEIAARNAQEAAESAQRAEAQAGQEGPTRTFPRSDLKPDQSSNPSPVMLQTVV